MDALPFFGFEDDDLSETRCRDDQRANRPIVYTPKMCAFEWYMDENNTIPKDQTEHAKFVILSGNQCFYKKQYDEARKHYKRGLALLPSNNSSLKRRFLDGIVRCSCYLKEYENAQKLAEKMVSDSNNDDQRSSALSLLHTVFRAKADIAGEIRTLEQWIDIHTLNAHLWKALSEVHTRKLTQNPPPEGRSEEENELRNENNKSIPLDEEKGQSAKDAENEDEVQLKLICACLITSRICLETFKGGLSSFAKLKTSKILTEIQKEVERLGLNEDVMRDIEEHSKVLVFSSKMQALDEQKDSGSGQRHKGETETKHKTGLCFQRHYFPWLFQVDAIPS